MISELRNKFNNSFTVEKYEKFIADINVATNHALAFRVCETPLFLDDELANELVTAAEDIVEKLQHKSFYNDIESAIPNKFNIPGEEEHPYFLQIDLGITKDNNGKLTPRLIELQAFPSMYSYQVLLWEKLKENFEVEDRFSPYFNGLDNDSYKAELKKTILGDEDPSNVILLEIAPENQKTWIDFYLTKQYFGIEPVCITNVFNKGDKLFYKKDGKEIQIKRMYNRMIFDELESKKIIPGFDLKKDYDVIWRGHSNWFFKISKHSLPKIKSKYCEEAFYLNDIIISDINLEDYVLKPLFSFAGSGVVIDVTKNDITKIKDPENYILQKKVKYADLILTPDGYSKAEIRMMYLWNEKPLLVNNLIRMSKGKMMGVDFNKDKTWIGSSSALHRL